MKCTQWYIFRLFVSYCSVWAFFLPYLSFDIYFYFCLCVGVGVRACVHMRALRERKERVWSWVGGEELGGECDQNIVDATLKQKKIAMFIKWSMNSQHQQ